jgi:hypothetical protein
MGAAVTLSAAVYLFMTRQIHNSRRATFILCFSSGGHAFLRLDDLSISFSSGEKNQEMCLVWGLGN